MASDRSDDVIETVADGLRMQVGHLPGDYAPALLKPEPAAYLVGFAVGVSRAMDVEVGNHTIRILERGCRQGLPSQGDLGQRLADIATRMLLGSDALTDDEALVAIRTDAEAEGHAFVDDLTPPTGLKKLVNAE